MSYATQADVDAAFADLDSLLEKRETGGGGNRACPGCGGCHFERCANPGMGVQFYSCCVGCGAVQATNFGCSDAELRPRRPFSNYKRRKNNDGSTTQREVSNDNKAYPKRDKTKKITPEIIGKFDEKMDNNQ